MPLFRIFVLICLFRSFGPVLVCTLVLLLFYFISFVLFCVLRFANNATALCSALLSPSWFACFNYVCMRASPRKHRVCEVLFPRFPVCLYAFLLYCCCKAKIIVNKQKEQVRFKKRHVLVESQKTHFTKMTLKWNFKRENERNQEVWSCRSPTKTNYEFCYCYTIGQLSVMK